MEIERIGGDRDREKERWGSRWRKGSIAGER